ncbi:MAG: hypothetical protein WCA63_07985 [Gallionella sp.]
MNNWFLRIPPKYWAYSALLLWGALSYMLLNKTPYGIDEGAARALLLVWSVADDVVSPIVTLGLPDFRTIFFVPVGYLWSGNVVAAKIFTLLVMSCAVWGIHRWRQHSGNSESALLASGLLLISPLLIDQIDTISVAPYLLVIFALGAWSDQIYRESPQAFGGMYFFQILLCLMSVTLHPAGLAYPLALLWGWYRNPADAKHKIYFFSGIVFVVFFALLLTLGWNHTEWFSNPVISLSGLFSGSSSAEDAGIFRWVSGIGMIVILLLVIWKQAGNLWADFLGRTLLIALIIGIPAGDKTWSIIVLAICLYWGLPLLLPTRTDSSGGFWGQRGIAMTLLFILSTTFMMADKTNYQMMIAGYLSPRDSLIKTLAEDRGNFLSDAPGQNPPAKKPVRVASQWPGLTMLACRCDALPLPPSAKDSEGLLAMLRGVNYLIFDPRDPNNTSLARNLATMEAGKTETVALQKGGVIVEIKNAPPAQKP